MFDAPDPPCPATLSDVRSSRLVPPSLRLPVLLLAALLFAAVLQAPASAAPAAPPTASAAAADFYRAPTPLPAGRPGQLIRYRQGLGSQCAPSKQMVAGTEYEMTGIRLALSRGWGVVVTDYFGYTTGSTPSYTVGPDMAHAALDIARTARQVPHSGAGTGTRWAVWGYSQGGGASGWTSALQPSYAPDVHLVAGAAGGVPADPKAVGDSLNGNLGAGFLLMALIGNQVTYPKQWPFSPMLNPSGVAAVRTIEQQCVDQALTTFAFKDLNQYLTPPNTLTTFEARTGVRQVLAANQLAARPAPRVPVYQYHSLGDEVVPLAQAQALHRTWCGEGVRTRLDLYPGEHITGDPAGASAAVQWIDDVFSGRAVVTDCLT
jgi:Secretory lipase